MCFIPSIMRVRLSQDDPDHEEADFIHLMGETEAQAG